MLPRGISDQITSRHRAAPMITGDDWQTGDWLRTGRRAQHGRAPRRVTRAVAPHILKSALSSNAVVNVVVITA